MRKVSLILFAAIFAFSCNKKDSETEHTYACSTEELTEYYDTTGHTTYQTSYSTSNFDTLFNAKASDSAAYVNSNTDIDFTIVYKHDDTIKGVTHQGICLKIK